MLRRASYRYAIIAGASALSLSAAMASGAVAQDQDEPAATPVVEPEAMDALKRMGAYLRTLQAFEVSADATRDDVADTGETIEYASRLTIKARLPDRLRVDVSSDRKQRQYFYDGETVVIYAPTLGAFARFDGAPTIRETLEIANANYELDLPLADLFTWGTEDDDSGLIVDAFSVGMSRIGGEECEHFVYRQESVDWQLWVRTGDTPLPCRLVITSTDDESRPRYTTTLDWDLEAEIADGDFVFTPTEGAYEIAIAPATDEDEEDQ